ncbi:hypothetical protein ACFPYI_12350 [Halomarina salina]|uniref:Uncharacterized protein n=1 Tax=Halomarina salina TaxID=1872699 RepID=A0ABD5RP40_9EURY|nr:hypothetical protein [Halomarina salina]
MWQEYIITAVTLVLTVSVLPTIRDRHAHIPLATSGLTTAGLFVKTLMFGSMGMTYPAAGAGLGCLMWALLAYLRSGIRERLVPSPPPTPDSTVAEFAVGDD